MTGMGIGGMGVADCWSRRSVGVGEEWWWERRGGGRGEVVGEERWWERRLCVVVGVEVEQQQQQQQLGLGRKIWWRGHRSGTREGRIQVLRPASVPPDSSSTTVTYSLP
jgi:hypothetical protein